MNLQEIEKPGKKGRGFLNFIIAPFKEAFLAFDRKVDGSISFFIKHYGKTRFMIAMSKKVQYLGIEKLWNKGPKAFVYFFLFYLVRDTILYIILPIYFARIATN
jgi:hypothetical protein